MVGLVLGVLQAVIVSLVCYAVIAKSLPYTLGNETAGLANEAHTAALVLVIASGLQLAIQPLQGMQLGALQGNIQFAFQAFANFSVIVGLFVIKLMANPTLTTFCIVMSVLPLIVNLVSVTAFAVRHLEKFKIPSLEEFLRTAKSLYRNGLAFLIINLSTYAVLYGPTFFLAWMTHGKEYIAFSIYNRVIFFLVAFVWLLAMPLWPALVKARVDGDEKWVRRAARTCFLLFASLASVLFLVVGLFGRPLVDFWTGTTIGQSPIFALVFAAYYVLVIWREFLITLLISFERVPAISAVQLLQTVVAYGLAIILVPRFGELGMALAMTLGIAFTSGWLLPMLRVRSPSGVEHSVANLFLTDRKGIAAINPKRP